MIAFPMLAFMSLLSLLSRSRFCCNAVANLSVKKTSDIPILFVIKLSINSSNFASILPQGSLLFGDNQQMVLYVIALAYVFGVYHQIYR